MKKKKLTKSLKQRLINLELFKSELIIIARYAFTYSNRKKNAKDRELNAD